ncbi:MAG: hypothetical protein SFW67_19840 [Myxococcaceae bacterium]|nr:hypothetical protein [Myxococcaceae bacterium]
MRSGFVVFCLVCAGCGRSEVVDDDLLLAPGPLLDAGRLDAGPRPDAGRVDAGLPADAGSIDAGTRDAGTTVDAGPRDAGTVVDAGGPDASIVDAGAPFDAGLPFDAGPPCLGLPVDAVYELTESMNPFTLSTSYGFIADGGVLRLVVPAGSTIGGTLDGGPAISVVGARAVCVEVAGAVIGAGGGGGGGGNGGSGGNPRPCSRDGAPGGPALFIDGDAEVTVRPGGLIAGGGGGGTGYSGCNLSAGGGGGAGVPAGRGGEPATPLSNAQELAFCGQDNGVRSGVAGRVGQRTTGGSSMPLGFGGTSSPGGALGQPGGDSAGTCVPSGAQPGAAGPAITGRPGSTRRLSPASVGQVLGRIE